jgi:hypothetical protein
MRGGFYDLFFPKTVRNLAGFEVKAVKVFERVRDRLIGPKPGDHEPRVTISCDEPKLCATATWTTRGSGAWLFT